MLTTFALLFTLAAPAPCTLDVLGGTAGKEWSLTEPLGRTLAAAGTEPAHVGALTSAHERSELFFSKACAEQARALAGKLGLPPDAVQPLTWKSPHGLTLAVSGVETRRLQEALASRDPARVQAAIVPLADASGVMNAAVERDDPALLRVALDAGLFVAPHWCKSAASDGRGKALKLVLERAPHCARKDALIAALQQGRLEAVRVLLEAGVPASEPGGWNGLWLARTPELANLLLSRGASLDSALEESSDPAMVTLLLAKGAKVDARDRNGWTPLHHAAWAGDDARVKLLLGKGADPNARTRLGVEEGLSGYDEDPGSIVLPAGSTPLDVARASLQNEGDGEDARDRTVEALEAAGAKENVKPRRPCDILEAVGFAAAGDAFALRWRCAGDEDSSGPRAGAGAERAIAFCSGAKGCAGLLEVPACSFEKAGCAKPEARAAQAAADAELAARGIRFGASRLTCKNGKGDEGSRCPLPAGWLRPYGIDAQAWVVHQRKDHVDEEDFNGVAWELHVTLHVDGLDELELAEQQCTQMCNGPHFTYIGDWLAPDGHLLVFGSQDEIQTLGPAELAGRLLLSRANARLRSSNAKGAADDAAQALKLAPGSASAAFVAARAAARLGKVAEAMALVERALKAEPGLARDAGHEQDLAPLRGELRFWNLAQY